MPLDPLGGLHLWCSTSRLPPFTFKMSTGKFIESLVCKTVIGKYIASLCCSRKYPYPYHGRFFKLNPPPLRIFHFSVLLLFKKIRLLKPLSPLEFPLTFHGVGMDIFWNYTFYKSVINIFLDLLCILFFLFLHFLEKVNTLYGENEENAHDMMPPTCS